ncbi:hypothetical protein [Pelagicoccus sp. SDUM812003]|uniref:THUMP domain-containing class I SAM-dependent RNA methyltransferase n=1 Tax=Pelagicoccus sp. SDUM812003 TaxID=3041267 RepID=UPI0028105D39|nr:hypothetical protein [Pelagicoccus sp. SDUM812003]MDQ8203748.1 hypothetical protein [Pelagicoccus sp. SDUM812003]
MQKRPILVTCPKACSGYLAQELESLGYSVHSEVSNGVFTEGDYRDCIRLNLSLRTGLRVLWQVGEFLAHDGEDLYYHANKMPWESWIPEDGYLSIVSSIRNDTVNNTKYPNLRLKDAIVDRIRDETGQRPDSGNERDRCVVFLYWQHDDVCLYLDTSGVPLSNRGYRVMPGKAPVRENLASSIIAATRWDYKSPFLNPMCGSGTLAIEAALMASQIPGNLRRDNFSFMHFKPYRDSDYKELREELRKRVPDSLPFPIIASDIDREAIKAAETNARKAGVDHLIEFRVCDFRDAPIPEEAGVMVLNPEYGERLGEQRKLEQTYKEIGDLFKQRCPGYWGYIFTGNKNLGKRVGLKTKRRIEFYNGPIECRLLEYELYDGTRNPKYLNQND